MDIIQFTDEGGQIVDLHTILPLLCEYDILLHGCDTLVHGCDTMLYECDTLVQRYDTSLCKRNNFWNFNIETLIGIFLDIHKVLVIINATTQVYVLNFPFNISI